MYYAFYDLNLESNVLNYLNYNMSETRFKEIKEIIGAYSFKEEYPFGEETVDIINFGNLKIVHLKNIVRQCGKSTLCRELCKRVNNSVYVNNKKLMVNHTVDSKQRSIVCNRPEDLRKLQGVNIRLICFDDFYHYQVNRVKYYIEPLRRQAYEPMTAVFIG